MKKLKLVISQSAYSDAAKLAHFIENDLKSRRISDKYMQELDNTVEKLSVYANAIGKNEYIQKMFGKKARHITYKKMAIVFFVEQKTIYIHRIIASSLIH